MKDTILVTGGTGYIGSHTVVELIEAGYEVIVIDNLENSTKDVLDGIEAICGSKPVFHKLDLRDKNELKRLLENHPSISGIIHFAAYKAVGESVQQPLKYYHNNLLSLLNLLECMHETNVKNLVFSSSCTVYGQPEFLPVNESAKVTRPASPYGNTKKISEEIIEDVVAANQLQCISLRYFNPIGAHVTAQIGELPIGVPNNLVPFITQTAAGKRKELVVFGDNYNTKDGTCVRDYIHVVDLAKAHVKAIERLIGRKNKNTYEIFNLGTGNGFSVMEIIKTFEKVTNQKLAYRIGEKRPGDVQAVYADTALANSELGWKATETLDSMLLSAWNWQKNLDKILQHG